MTTKFNINQEVFFYEQNKIHSAKIHSIIITESSNIEYHIQCYDSYLFEYELFPDLNSLESYLINNIKIEVDRVRGIK